MSNDSMTDSTQPTDQTSRANTIKVPIYLFLLALTIRVIYVSQYARSPFCWVPQLDSLYNLQEAAAIVSGHVAHSPYWRAPLYSHFLALVQLVFGHNLLAPHAIQMVIGSANCVLLYFIGKHFFSGRTAIVAAAGMALYGPMVFNDGELQTPAIELLLDLALILLALSASRAHNTDGYTETSAYPDSRKVLLLWTAAGFVLGLSAITRPTILLCAPLFAWLAWTKRPADTGRRIGLASVAMFAVAAALLPAVVTARNAIVGHDRVFIASQGGINLWIGNRLGADGFTPKTPKHYAFDGGYQDAIELYGQRAAEEAVGHKLKPSESQAYWVKQTLDVWRTHPAASLGLLWKRFVLTWTHTEIRDNVAFDYMRKEWTPSLWFAFLNFGMIAPLALAGMLIAWRYASCTRWLAVFAIFYMTTFCVFFAAERFRLPVVPILLLFAAYFAVLVFDLLRSRNWKFAGAALALTVPFALAVNIDWYRVVTPDVVALDYWSAGNRYSDLRRYDAAIPQYQTALKLDPSNAEIWMNLGVAQYYLGDAADAIGSFQTSLRLNETAQAYFDLGMCYEQSGDLAAASKSFEAAYRMYPAYTRAHDEWISVQNKLSQNQLKPPKH